MDRETARRLLEWLSVDGSLHGETPEVHEKLLSMVTDVVERRCGKSISANGQDSLALTITRAKTAALAFDRVYRVPIHIDPVPEQISFYGATEFEVCFWGAGLVALAARDMGVPTKVPLDKDQPDKRSPSGPPPLLRELQSELTSTFRLAPTLLYSDAAACNSDYKQGSSEVIAAAISNIALVDENQLTWEQVLEFRKDAPARAKYRRLSRWVDAELVSKPPAQVLDEIAIRLDDYDWALTKHGIRCAVGSLSCLLDPKFAALLSATTVASIFTSGSPWGALLGISLAVGGSLVSFANSYVDSKDEIRANNFEVAYIHEVRHQAR